MKKTKIICSIGPSTQVWENFKGIVEAGMNVARINFSHATLEERALDESLIKRANEELGANIATLYDTKGPEFRNGLMEDNSELVVGNEVRIIKKIGCVLKSMLSSDVTIIDIKEHQIKRLKVVIKLF